MHHPATQCAYSDALCPDLSAHEWKRAYGKLGFGKFA